MSTDADFPTPSGADQPHRPTYLPSSAIRWRRAGSQSLSALTSQSTRFPSPVLIASQTLSLPLESATLVGELELPMQASGLVVFGHGSGSSCHSSRSRHLSRLLQQADLGVFSVDLLTPAEERLHAGLGQLPHLTQRLVALCGWLRRQPELVGLRLGLLGEGVVAAAALDATQQLGAALGALVSLGAGSLRASPGLPAPVPTLLLVGEHDASKAHMTHQAQAVAAEEVPRALQVIPQAGPTFQEPGTLAQVGTQTAAWFNCYLSKLGNRCG